MHRILSRLDRVSVITGIDEVSLINKLNLKVGILESRPKQGGNSLFPLS